METFSVAEAKANLSTLIDRAAAGQAVQITRRGKLIAQITAAPTPRQPIDIAALRALTESMPFQSEDSGTFVRRMRDEDRY